MPGYADTKKLIEDTLVNRPAGTVIIPEDHQTFALSMLDYIHSVELLGASSLQGSATVDTVPVQPLNSRVSYISSVPPGQTYVYTNFLDENGDPITVTSGANTLSLLTLLWNGEYWTVSATPLTLAIGYTDGYLFKGIAAPTDNPGTPDQNVFYIAGGAGTYTNFGGIEVVNNEFAILLWNGSWTKEVTNGVTLDLLNESLSQKANIDGSYDGMSVGIARNLEGRTDVTDSFFQRTTGGDAEVANGTAQLNEVKGKSQVWNQLVQNGNFADGTTGWTSAGTVNYQVSDGILSVTTGANGAAGIISSSIVYQNIVGHKMYGSCLMKQDATQGDSKVAFRLGGQTALQGSVVYLDNNTNWQKLSAIATATEGNANFYLTGRAGNISFKAKNCFLIDLTLLGIDNLTTVEEVEAWLAENIGEQAYYPYNPGEVLNNRMTGVESIGFNLLNPATGKADIIGAYSDVYGNYYGITGTHGTLTFTDKFGNEETITPDEDGKFLLEKAGELSVADAGEDCAVFLWWDGTQTEYKPYEKNVGALDVTHIYGKLNGEGEYVRVWPTGMPGIGDIKDSLKIVDGHVVAERKVGEIDLGTMTWTYESQNERMWGAGCPFNYRTSWQAAAYAKCGKYVVMIWDSTKDKFIAPNGNGRIYVRDSAYTDAATFKNAVAGILYYFELATPQVFTDLIYRDSEAFADNTPVTLPVNYKVDNWGIERIAPQNTEEAVVTTKPELTMRYSIDAVEELNTHRDEIEDLYEKNEELDQRKPEKYGEYPDMAVGSAKSIAGDIATDAEFKFRKTGGNNAVGSGLAKLTAVYGKSLVWNQLVGDDTESVVVVNGHKYLSVIGGVKAIGESDGNAIAVTGGTDMVIDLALMFGAGNEPATVAEFEAMFPLPYYDYNAGEIVSNKAEAIETTGFNQWDEEWETGAFNTTTGQNSSSSNQIRSKNLIPVFGNTKYYIRHIVGVNIQGLWCAFYDADKEMIDATDIPEKTSSSGKCVVLRGLFTVPADAAYMRFYTQTNYGGTYKNDICINISDQSRNGEYESYRKYTLPLNIPTLTGKLNGEGESVVVCLEGLMSVPNGACDELVIKNGYAISIIKRIGKYTFIGNESCLDCGLKDGGYGVGLLKSVITNAKNRPDVNRLILIGIDYNSYSNIYIGQTGVTMYDAGGANYAGFVRVAGTTSKAEVLAWLAGRTLYYEYEVPEEYILDEPLFVGYQEDVDGTEKRLPEDTAESVMPAFPCKIAYPVDVVKAINELGQTYVPRSEWAKWGVKSQTLNWSKNQYNGYDSATPSNKVYGWIPNSNIDLYVSAGASFNEATGYFEMNGVADIAYDEMMQIYRYTFGKQRAQNYAYAFSGMTSFRTNFNLFTGGANGYGSTGAEDVDIRAMMMASRFVVFAWTIYENASDLASRYRKVKNADYAFRSEYLKRVIGVVNVGNLTSIESSIFANAYNLEDIKLRDLKASLQMPSCASISLASMVFMVENCGTIPVGGITITLHATAYARCVADTTEYTYNEQTYTGIIALAAAKNITIQSA